MNRDDTELIIWVIRLMENKDFKKKIYKIVKEYINENRTYCFHSHSKEVKN